MARSFVQKYQLIIEPLFRFIISFMASIMMLASCGNASTSNQVDTQCDETEVITSEVSQERIIRVDRCIQSHGHASSSYVIILTETGQHFRFSDRRNESFSNVREGDIANVRYFSNGEKELESITYVIKK